MEHIKLNAQYKPFKIQKDEKINRHREQNKSAQGT